jgi:hypothetical protein
VPVGELPVTVAVQVTDWPYVEGFCPELRAVFEEVCAWLTANPASARMPKPTRTPRAIQDIRMLFTAAVPIPIVFIALPPSPAAAG